MTVGELYDKKFMTCMSFYIVRPGEDEYTPIDNKQVRAKVKDCEVRHYSIGRNGDGSLAMIISIDKVKR